MTRAAVTAALLGALACAPMEPVDPDARCTRADECGRGGYCERPFRSCDAPGRCVARPEVCTELFAPVCGCDGATYANDCKAHAAGVAVRSRGECPSL